MNPKIQMMLQQAFQYMRQANFSQAKPLLTYILKIQPKNFDVLHALGFISGIENNHPEVIHYSSKALKIKPDDLEANINCAKALQELGKHLDSVRYHQKAIFLSPNNHEVWLGCGKSLQSLKQYGEAIAHYDKALSLKPDYAAAWSNKGNTLNELRRHDEAIACFDKALSLKPDFAEAWSNKGITLHELKQYGEAIAHYDKALSLKPDYAAAWSNKGNTLNELRRHDEAIACFDKALSLKSDYHEAWSNKGVTLHELKRYDEAIAYYDKALSLKSDYHEASWNKSLTLLLQGDFENGLPLYESRWNCEKVSEIVGKRIFNEPTWLGVESLRDKVILLYGEQGFGDYIQFCRYVKLVADLGAKVILEVPQPLAKLMESLQGVSQLVVKSEILPHFDYQCPLLSLPLAFKTTPTTIPCSSPYLFADSKKAEEWGLKLGQKRKKRIGVVWSSVSSFKDDAKRSLRLEDFVKALPPEDFEYICLQKELKESDKEFFDDYKNIRFYGDELIDFSDTAALIENVDLVIGTCTSIPHLSGALGKETWILLSDVPDWRWLLDREDSPWYPSIKLFRQPAIGYWSRVLDKVKLDLTSSFS